MSLGLVSGNNWPEPANIGYETEAVARAIYSQSFRIRALRDNVIPAGCPSLAFLEGSFSFVYELERELLVNKFLECVELVLFFFFFHFIL